MGKILSAGSGWRLPEIAPEEINGDACVVIRSMAGDELMRFETVPPTVSKLKQLIAESGDIPVALQQLLREDGLAVCADYETLGAVNQEFTLLHDDTPQWSWDLEGNPSKAELDIEGGVVKCPKLRTDYANVLTQEPVTHGLHYFEFHMHYYGDEQWCGLSPDKTFAGPGHKHAIPSKSGWMYYTGRSEGALEAQGRRLKKFEYVGRSNSIIGMLVDCDNGAVGFDLNGSIQGACEIPKNTPFWILTHLDTRNDHVELRKLSLEDAPPANLHALKGALLDVSEGTVMSRSY